MAASDTPAVIGFDQDIDKMTFDDLQQYFDSGAVTHIQELDDVVVVEKDTLVDKEMVITSWRLRTDDESNGFGPYVVVKCALRDGSHVVFADGSTGIKEQLIAFDTHNPIYLPKGLRVSTYMWTDPADGKEKPAKTFYLNNAA